MSSFPKSNKSGVAALSKQVSGEYPTSSKYVSIDTPHFIKASIKFPHSSIAHSSDQVSHAGGPDESMMSYDSSKIKH